MVLENRGRQPLTADDSDDLATTAFVTGGSPRLIIPSGVQNGTQTADGGFQVTAGGASASPLTALGVFDWTKYLRYRVLFSGAAMSTPTASVLFRFGASGTIDASANYEWVITHNNGSALSAVAAAATTGIRVVTFNSETSSPGFSGSLEIVRFDTSSRIQITGISGKTLPTVSADQVAGDYHPANSSLVTDLAMLVAPGTGNMNFRIYGE